MTRPKHVRGRCDLGDCDSLATWAYRDGGIYIEVCHDHARRLSSQFDSEYEAAEHRSPYRDSGPSERVEHDCGGEVLVYDTDDGEYRVCDSCSYALLVHDTGEKSMEVSHSEAYMERPSASTRGDAR